ncbi:MAG: hypothetical protein LIV24_07925 [Eubacterium sp.]|nr:hypothetical protein [Eubacterium sp.]
MLADTIQAVKSAEAEADQIIAKARDQSASVLKQAHLDADRAREKAEQDSGKILDRRMEEARRAGEARLKEAEDDAREKCAQLRRTASKEENAAVAKVISLVIG